MDRSKHKGNHKQTFWSAFTAGMGFAFARWVRKVAPLLLGLILVGGLWIMIDILQIVGLIA